MSYINPLCPSSARIAQIPSQTFYLFHPSLYQYYSSVVKHGILVILPPADAIYLIITIHKSHPQSQHPRGDPHPREEEGLIFNTQETISSVNPVIWIHIYRSQSLFYVVPRENWVSQTNRLKLSEILINHSNSNDFRSPVISVYFYFFAQFMQDLLHWFWILFVISPHFTQFVIYKKQAIHLNAFDDSEWKNLLKNKIMETKDILCCNFAIFTICCQFSSDIRSGWNCVPGRQCVPAVWKCGSVEECPRSPAPSCLGPSLLLKDCLHLKPTILLNPLFGS